MKHVAKTRYVWALGIASNFQHMIMRAKAITDVRGNTLVYGFRYIVEPGYIEIGSESHKWKLAPQNYVGLVSLISSIGKYTKFAIPEYSCLPIILPVEPQHAMKNIQIAKLVYQTFKVASIPNDLNSLREVIWKH